MTLYYRRHLLSAGVYRASGDMVGTDATVASGTIGDGPILTAIPVSLAVTSAAIFIEDRVRQTRGGSRIGDSSDDDQALFPRHYKTSWRGGAAARPKRPDDGVAERHDAATAATDHTNHFPLLPSGSDTHSIARYITHVHNAPPTSRDIGRRDTAARSGSADRSGAADGYPDRHSPIPRHPRW